MPIKNIDLVDFTQKLIFEPEDAITRFNLVYISREKLSIARIKDDKGFLYLYHDKPLRDKKELKRIDELVIPPAWEKVKIAPKSNAHLQAIGFDLKKRRQYRYHPIWLKIRNRTKFYKMNAFGEALSAIRKRTEEDLNLEGWPKNKVLALIIKLMEETHIRVGNEQYAKRNKTYGLSTLRTKHLKGDNKKLRFEFTGKRGKKHKITLKNKKLVRLVNQCEEIPGWELFQFYDTDGKKTSVDSGMVNSYIHEISGQLFTAKDFRTWAGTLIFFEALMEFPKTNDEKVVEKNILKAFDKTAQELGNTRNVCRKYYIHPYVVKSYKDKSIYPFFDKIEDVEKVPHYSPTEVVLLKLIKQFKPLENIIV
jgi:DNA topoisomerase-1